MLIKFLVGFLFSISALAIDYSKVEEIKIEIFQLAEKFKGQGDPDRSKQQQLEILVSKLLEANPQPPINERLHLLYGPWQQIWGPYDYRNNNRGVDPTLDVNHIYQVVFDGYYYNVNPSLDKNGNPKNTVLLRGAFSIVEGTSDTLKAEFTDLRHIKGLPQNGLRFQDLPELSEQKSLPGERTTIPSFLVKFFFGGGFLQEVYTDHDLRITFGSGSNDKVQNYIYIMKRVAE
jgi:hypothetical protein